MKRKLFRDNCSRVYSGCSGAERYSVHLYGMPISASPFTADSMDTQSEPDVSLVVLNLTFDLEYSLHTSTNSEVLGVHCRGFHGCSVGSGCVFCRFEFLDGIT
ncbi:hypothetical protein DPMN_024786 [Dreissena polymorpha]|uniref:Uncharacterized protein n=1 Tax=Dreissena polymorpha TaxID=45954 RepID=A0A9D4LPJ9_DREPO|nr:hypothetical protein DPMN_024786 [Dreissena polymorpha]